MSGSKSSMPTIVLIMVKYREECTTRGEDWSVKVQHSINTDHTMRPSDFCILQAISMYKSLYRTENSQVIVLFTPFLMTYPYFPEISKTLGNFIQNRCEEIFLRFSFHVELHDLHSRSTLCKINSLFSVQFLSVVKYLMQASCLHRNWP